MKEMKAPHVTADKSRFGQQLMLCTRADWEALTWLSWQKMPLHLGAAAVSSCFSHKPRWKIFHSYWRKAGCVLIKARYSVQHQKIRVRLDKSSGKSQLKWDAQGQVQELQGERSHL